MKPDILELCVPPTHSLREVIGCIDKYGLGIVFVTDSLRHLMGTITDGDIRRAILSGVNLDLPVQMVLDQKAKTPYPKPLSAPYGTPVSELLHLMNTHAIRHIPLLDETQRIVDVALLSDLVKEYEQPLSAVVMAGGFGKRLYPLTEDVPKPMLPIGDRPILEWTIEQLKAAGIHRVNMTTHYKKDVIMNHFGDGRNFGVDIRYVAEDRPLGTAGALSLLDKSDEPLLVINGDILTHVDFRAMLDFHREHQGDMTVAVRVYEYQVPYGVVAMNGSLISSISEKPLMRHFISAGIYLLNPEAYRYIPNNHRFDMPDLIDCLLKEGRRVVAFPVREYWIDIGHVSDYEQAQKDVAQHRGEGNLAKHE